MLTEDHILRQIAQFVAVLAKILGLSKAGQFQEACSLIDQAIEGLLGLNANIVKGMDEAGLVTLLTTGLGLDCGKLVVLADLFNVEGDVFAAQQRPNESKDSYQRALNLYYVFTAECKVDVETDILAKIEALEKMISSNEKEKG